MRRTIETIEGDTAGASYSFSAYHFDGPADGPSAYVQAALHGDELPGVVAIHALMPMLRRAEDEGRLRGRMTVVPSANPIGRAQYLFGYPQGRFKLDNRTNFNREFPLLATPGEMPPSSTDQRLTADQRLKCRLLELSKGHDIVLDLHCDDEGVPFLYVPKALWPAMADCAAAMNMAAVVLWEGSSDATFYEAVLHPYLSAPPDVARLDTRVVATVEYRGMADVDEGLARSDAAGLYRLLVRRGVIEDDAPEPVGAFTGIVAPNEWIEMVRAPRAGAVLYHVKPGDRVEEGAPLATIVRDPGEDDGTVTITAPQAGYILTRRVQRGLRAGDDVVKLVGRRPSASHKEGALES